MRVCKHVFFPAEKYFWDFFRFFIKTIDIVIFYAMIYIVRRYT